ncbi:hypothetical protein GQR58_000608 [Nymphon striatum]|nr:hypothetical protein GQR58_000608 [Nymphon striatum]
MDNTVEGHRRVRMKGASEMLIKRRLGVIRDTITEFGQTVTVRFVSTTENKADRMTRVPKKWLGHRDTGEEGADVSAALATGESVEDAIWAAHLPHHLGVDRTLYLARQIRSNLTREQVKRELVGCEACQRIDPARREENLVAQGSLAVDGNWRRVAVDVTHYGAKHYLSMVDCGPSRFAIWRRLSGETAASIIAQLQGIVIERGPCDEFLLDNSTAFRSAAVEQFADEWGISLRFRAAYAPSGNGIVERNHRTIKRIAERGGISPEEATFWYNVTPRKDTDAGSVPSNGLYRYTWRVPFDVNLVKVESFEDSPFAVGDEVWVKPPIPSCTRQWSLGIVSDVVSRYVVRVDGMPRHVKDIRKRCYGSNRGVVHGDQVDTAGPVEPAVLSGGDASYADSTFWRTGAPYQSAPTPGLVMLIPKFDIGFMKLVTYSLYKVAIKSLYKTGGKVDFTSVVPCNGNGKCEMKRGFPYRRTIQFTSFGNYNIFYGGIAIEVTGLSKPVVGYSEVCKNIRILSNDDDLDQCTLNPGGNLKRPKWPICDALEQFTGVHTGTSEQHKDMRQSNQSRDNKDRGIFFGWLQVHPTFVGYEKDRLVSLSTGIVADTSVNCDNAVELGLNAASEMAGKNQSTVVFDGYGSTTSTKVAEQRRRAQKCTSSDIIFEDNMPTTTTQAAFLANSHNKQRLIQTLHEKMLMSGIRVKQAEADADTLIVSTAIAVTESEEQSVVVVGTDTDLLVMLVARATTTTDLYMLCRGNPITVFNIHEIQHAIGDTRYHLMFLHAVTGCDTVSAIYRQGKRKAFNMVHIKREYDLLEMFTNNGSTHDEVKRAGETFVLKLYGASNYESLDKYRHIAYKRAIGRCSLSSSFQLASLPPTSAAAKQHSYRTYHTVQEWMGITLPPTEWGWRSHDGTLAPVETDRPVAPDSLLNMVSCGCKPDGCSNMTCSCNKLGLFCTSMCSKCSGQTCNNTTPSLLDVDDEEIEPSSVVISVEDSAADDEDE